MTEAIRVVEPGLRPWRARPGLMIFGAIGFLAVVYLLPMLTLAGWAFRDPKGGFTLAQAVKLATEETYHTAFVTTFRTASITTVVCALLGYPLAYLMATAKPRRTWSPRCTRSTAGDSTTAKKPATTSHATTRRSSTNSSTPTNTLRAAKTAA